MGTHNYDIDFGQCYCKAIPMITHNLFDSILDHSMSDLLESTDYQAIMQFL